MKPGHYFCEPLVSGGNLLGVWVFPEIESGKCFRIECRALPIGPYMFLRQSTEINCNTSHVFYVKVSSDPKAKRIQADTDHHQTGGMYLRNNQVLGAEFILIRFVGLLLK